MLRDHLVGDEDVADKQYVFRRKQHISASRHLRRYRVCVLLVLVLFGLHLLATRPGAGNSSPLTAQQAASAHASIQTAQTSASGAPLSVGMGVGVSSNERTASTLPAASCNPFDVICWLTNAVQWLGQQIINALQSVINGLLHGPLDIITQTPPADTYQNGTVIAWANAFLAVVDLALASLIVIGGYNVIVGRGLGLPHSAPPEFLPRLLLAFGAAHFSLFFLGLFIDLENALSGVALDLASHSMLTNVIAGIFQGNLLGEGFLVVVLAIVLGRADGGAPGTVVGLAGALRPGAGLLRAAADDGLWPSLALAHRQQTRCQVRSKQRNASRSASNSGSRRKGTS